MGAEAEMMLALFFAFLCGGAVGSVGTLLAQFIFKRVDGSPPRLGRRASDGAVLESLRGEVTDIGRHLRNLDARLDFTERMLDGGIPLAPRPGRLADAGSTEDDTGRDQEKPDRRPADEPAGDVTPE